MRTDSRSSLREINLLISVLSTDDPSCGNERTIPARASVKFQIQAYSRWLQSGLILEKSEPRT